MDWARIKSLLLLLLLLLNLFLGASLLYGSKAGTDADAYGAYLDGILEERGITVPDKWPNLPGNVGMLSFEREEPDAVKLLKRLMPGAQTVPVDQTGLLRQYEAGSRSLTVGDLGGTGNIQMKYEDTAAGYLVGTTAEEQRKQIGALLQAIGLFSYRLVLDGEADAEGGTRYAYVQRYKSGLIFDNQVTVQLRNGGITTMTLSLDKVRQMIAPPGGGAVEILSAQQALLLSPLRGPLEIQAIHFGWGQENKGELYFSPVWRFRLADGRAYRLNAYTGVLLQP